MLQRHVLGYHDQWYYQLESGCGLPAERAGHRGHDNGSAADWPSSWFQPARVGRGCQHQWWPSVSHRQPAAETVADKARPRFRSVLPVCFAQKKRPGRGGRSGLCLGVLSLEGASWSRRVHSSVASPWEGGFRRRPILHRQVSGRFKIAVNGRTAIRIRRVRHEFASRFVDGHLKARQGEKKRRDKSFSHPQYRHSFAARTRKSRKAPTRLDCLSASQ
jgi:hypothetical protein